MTTPVSDFADIAEQTLSVKEPSRPKGILGPLALERGTRSFGSRLVDNGFRTLGDLHGQRVIDIVGRVSTTRQNFDRAMHYFQHVGVTLS